MRAALALILLLAAVPVQAKHTKTGTHFRTCDPARVTGCVRPWRDFRNRTWR